MIAIDWSHTKGLLTYDGKKLREEGRIALFKRLKRESIATVESSLELHRSIVLEQGCPLHLTYDLLKTGSKVYYISNRATQDYRVEYGIEKTDENDAKIIYELSQNGAKLFEVNLSDHWLQMHEIYSKYHRYQKARVAMMNMKKAYMRQYGDGESNTHTISSGILQPSPYDIGIKALKEAENACLKELIGMEGDESTSNVPSITSLQSPSIRGLGPRIWIGILVTANPVNFKCLSAYLRFCGLTSYVIKNHKYNRHARMLYHMLAECTMKHRDQEFRPIYDKCKVDIAERHPEYTKMHIHNAALNRTATFLAKRMFNYCRAIKG